MYKVEVTLNFITNIYFLIIVLIGAFFLVNLTLAVITIFFMQSQEQSRNAIEQLKAKSQEELERTYKISHFEKIRWKRVLIRKDVSVFKVFNKVYRKLKTC